MGSWKVLEMSWIFLSVKEWEPCFQALKSFEIGKRQAQDVSLMGQDSLNAESGGTVLGEGARCPLPTS